MNIPSADEVELLFKKRRNRDKDERIARQAGAVEEGFASARGLPLLVQLEGPAEDEVCELLVEKGYQVKQTRLNGCYYIRIGLPEPVTSQ